MENLSKSTEDNTVLVPIIVEHLNDEDLLAIVDECQKDTWDQNSIIRDLAKQYFGDDSLLKMILVANKILPIVAERMRCYSPHL